MRPFTAEIETRRFAPVCHDIAIAGELVGLHDSGALWWPDENTLIVSDLHFEKASSYARRGVMLPPYDTAATLEKLAEVIDAFHTRYDVTVQVVETAQENVEFKVPRVLRETA